MGKYLQEYNIPRDNVRVILMTDDFIAQGEKIKDNDGSGEKMFFGCMRKSITDLGQGYGAEYPTIRFSILNPEPEILPSGEHRNLFCTLAADLIFKVSARDEDRVDIDLQREAHSLATYVWNWFTPGPTNGADDNPNGMNPIYPDVWGWQDKVRGKQDFGRNMTRILPTQDNKLTGSLYVIPLYLPIRVFNPLVPWPIQ